MVPQVRVFEQTLKRLSSDIFDAAVESLLRRYYDSPEGTAAFAAGAELKAAERALVERLRGEIAGGALLDVGVGAGRTAPALAPLGRRYLGVDYSLGMLARCRSRQVSAPLLACDARALALRAGSFDAAFCWDALGDVAHEGRRRLLAEIRRVLRPGGLLVLRANNLDAPWRSPWVPASLSWPREVVRHLRAARHRRHGPGWRVAGDPWFGHALLSYYVSREEQERQLAEAGFSRLEAARADGTALPAGEPCRDPFLFYAGRAA